MNFVIILAFVLVYYFGALKFFIGGDDFFLTVGGPHSLQEVLNQFVRPDQYRPIPYSILGAYTSLPHSTSLYHLISLITMSAVGYMLCKYMQSLGVKRLFALGMSLVYLVSHIYFYTAYALAGMVDLVFLLFFFATLLTFRQLYWLSLIMFIGAILSKEIFVSIPVILTMELWARRESKNWRRLLPYYLITIVIMGLKFYFYKSAGEAYTYHISLPLLIENLKHFALWLLNYRHGWQMGMPEPIGPEYVIPSAALFLAMTFAGISLWRSNQRRFWFVVIFVLTGLVPFYFLSRVLVFYLNVSWVAVVTAVGLGLTYIAEDNDKGARALMALILFMAVLTSYQIRQQWLKYSFVAVAEETASNFNKQVVQANDWSQVDRLCLTKLDGDGAWAVAHGDAIKLMLANPPQVFVENCNYDGGVVYQYEARGWQRVE